MFSGTEICEKQQNKPIDGKKTYRNQNGEEGLKIIKYVKAFYIDLVMTLCYFRGRRSDNNWFPPPLRSGGNAALIGGA